MIKDVFREATRPPRHKSPTQKGARSWAELTFAKTSGTVFRDPGHQLTDMSIVTSLVRITDTEKVFQSFSCFLRGELKFKQYIMTPPGTPE